jgi:hypothetical protein
MALAVNIGPSDRRRPPPKIWPKIWPNLRPNLRPKIRTPICAGCPAPPATDGQRLTHTAFTPETNDSCPGSTFGWHFRQSFAAWEQRRQCGMGKGNNNNNNGKHKKKLVGPADSLKPVMVELPKKTIRKDKEEYYGGGAGEPHIHVYPGGCHLKLGKNRYNLVQNLAIYKGKIDEAYQALRTHALHDSLRPWMDAALVLFNAEAHIPG